MIAFIALFGLCMRQHRRLDTENDWDAVNSQQRIKVNGNEDQVSPNPLNALGSNFSSPTMLDIGKTISILQSFDQPASKRFCGPQLLQQSINNNYGSSHGRHRNVTESIILRPYASSVWKSPRSANGSSYKRRSARASSLTCSEYDYNQANRLSPPQSPIIRPASESHAMFSSTEWNHCSTSSSNSQENANSADKANDNPCSRNTYLKRFTVTRCKSQPCFPTDDNNDSKRHQLKRQRSDEGLLVRPALDFMKMKETAFYNIEDRIKNLNFSGNQSQSRSRTDENNLLFKDGNKMGAKDEGSCQYNTAEKIGRMAVDYKISCSNAPRESVSSCHEFNDGNDVTNFYSDGIDSEIDIKAIENDCLETSDY
ncbi:uncharacterized protein TRIADDRAFT_61460 [Trichoplax adhaerens]|uniref:Uncharacterized protein n=1 Tax=Trichoplax adhaerens TaxID=10228 RepID=B3SB18_TRIAD|nr:predicted protein [Trichoplax adhaerens]EDV20032.1 predicted protein [Trichoplax adhaerens]|eukprot:XP_002117416.1 predicted protein [Trichoplax adhaerens]